MHQLIRAPKPAALRLLELRQRVPSNVPSTGHITSAPACAHFTAHAVQLCSPRALLPTLGIHLCHQLCQALLICDERGLAVRQQPLHPALRTHVQAHTQAVHAPSSILCQERHQLANARRQVAHARRRPAHMGRQRAHARW